MSGEKYPIEIDNEILKINSPRDSLEGPYTVVYKNIPERWAIVSMDWDGSPSLGIRWFRGNAGNPFSTGHPTWFVIPKSLINSILNGLPISFDIRHLLNKYLSGEITGEQLVTKIGALNKQ